jgi:mercuric ion transport protein
MSLQLTRREVLAVSDTSPARLHPAAGPNQSEQTPKAFRWATAGGIVGALGIASCCLLPLILLSLGLGGAWVGRLTALAPFKPLFIVLAVALLGYGHYLVYFASKKACIDGNTCPTPRTTRRMKVVLWAATALAIVGLGIEYVEPYLIG